MRTSGIIRCEVTLLNLTISTLGLRSQKILTEPAEAQRNSYIALLALTLRVLECGIGLLGFTAPEKM